MNGYLVIVEGDYFGRPVAGERKKDKFPYRVEVRVPKADGALSLIKNKLLDKVLSRNYDNYHAYRTHQLVSITNLDGSKVYGLTDPQMMDFNELADYVIQHKLPLKLELYTDLGYFRKMVGLAETNQKAFLLKQATLAVDSEEDRLLAELNPDLDKPAVHRLPNNIDKAVSSDNKAAEVYARSVEDIEPVGRETNITQGEIAKVDPEATLTKDGQHFQTVVDPSSNMITEDKPKTQEVKKVYIPGKGFVDVDDFKEDFDREDEKEFETYDPAGLNDPSGTGGVHAEPDDIPEAGEAVSGNIVDEL